MRNHFFSGFLFSVACSSLCQDFLGLERYIQMAREYWVSPWVSIPTAILFLTLSAIHYVWPEEK